MVNNFNKLQNFWRGKKVFLTGHTGFKGSWLCLFLNMLGAKVIGYSLRPAKNPNLYNLANLNKKIYSSIVGDIRDYDKLKKIIHKYAPDFVIHMAAQPLVLDSYANPKYTYEVNIMGTVNILSILKDTSSVKATLITTTDKVYFNNNKKKYFKESDILGGIDPYSNSKSCAEFVVNSYIQSFFKKKNCIATARAGNVIGGGDFSKDRILPDYFRSLSLKKKLIIRSPNSIRPWQHVLDPLNGYLLLLMYLYKNKKNKNYSFNFGPIKSNNLSVNNVIKLLNKNFGNSVKLIKKKTNERNYYESKILMLNSNKSKKILKWRNKYNLEQSIKLTSDWFKAYLMKKNIAQIMEKQIKNFIDL